MSRARPTGTHRAAFVGGLGLLGALLLLSIAARPVAAQDTWSGSGSFTISSTPSNPPCDGSGSATISMSGTPGGSFTADLVFDLTSQSSACGGALNSGEDSTISGTLSGTSFSATDADGDSITGSLSSTFLSLTLTTPSQGSDCAALCVDTLEAALSGSGALGDGGPFQAFLLSPDGIPALFASLFAFLSLGLALASFPGRIPPVPSPGAASLAPTGPLPPVASPSVPPSLTGPPWSSMPGSGYPMVNGPDIPPGAVRLNPDPAPTGPDLPPHDPYPKGITAPSSGNPAVCPKPGCPLAWNETGWYCLNPVCPYRDMTSPRSQAPAPGKPFGFPGGAPPPGG